MNKYKLLCRKLADFFPSSTTAVKNAAYAKYGGLICNVYIWMIGFKEYGLGKVKVRLGKSVYYSNNHFTAKKWATFRPDEDKSLL